MHKTIYLVILITLLISCKNKSPHQNIGKKDMYDGPEHRAYLEYKKTKNPSTGKVPRGQLVPALNYANNLKNIFNRVTAAGTWVERGPSSDVVGLSNGNTRANNGITAGRVRAVLVDANDATGNTLWVGGVNGGLWKNTNIASTSPAWTFVDDFFSNMAITSICQDPTAPQTMYFATGEWCFNLDAVAGDGVWKTTNGGTTWTQLSSTTGTNFDYCSKIICDAAGNIYITTRSGVYRSTKASGGAVWTTITPSGLGTSRFSDIEISSSGRLFVSSGVFSANLLRYTDNPTTVTTTTWTAPTTAYPNNGVRTEIACSGATVYALPSNAAQSAVPTIYKSTDGGVTFAATTGQPTSGWATQPWYCLGIDTDPANANNVIVGGLDCYKTTDGGGTWAKISEWVGTAGQYVHADIHFIDWYSSNRVIFGCDGGIHYSSDAGTTIRDRNTGLRIKQFYAVDAHPTSTNIFLGGTQDNGMHQFSVVGLGASTEVTGGDGAFAHIDQNAGANMFGSFVYNVYRRSTNTGSSWSSVRFYRGSPGTYGVNYDDFGLFINPSEFDDVNNIMYASSDGGEFFRWTTPLTTTAGNYYSATSFSTANAEIVDITSLGTAFVTALKVSPFTNNRLYLGTENGDLFAINNANTIASGSAATTDLSTGLPAAEMSCVNTGTTDNNLIVSYSNYGVSNVWVSINGGTSWTAIDGNLPDMPVRWAMFYPGDNTKAIIATEAGVWITELINGASTSWYVSPTFPLVRTDMLAYRSSDNLLVAATHGRGIWTQSAGTILPINDFVLNAKWINNNTQLQWNYQNASSQAKFEVLCSYDGINYSSVGIATYNGTTNYSFAHTPTHPKVFYRVKVIEHNLINLYSNIAKLDKGIQQFELWHPSPNPVGNTSYTRYNTNSIGIATVSIIDMTGKTVWQKNETITARGNYFLTANTDKLAKGQYLLKMEMNSFVATQSFMKQ